MNSSASDDTDAETYDESYDTDNSDAEKIEPFIQNHIHTSKELKNPVKDFSALFYIFTMLLSGR